jgi:peptidoglycan hydrolase FlgJ
MTKLAATPTGQLPPIQQPVPPSAATVSRPPPSADRAAIAKSAHDFEAMAIGQLLQPMFDTVTPTKGGFGGGPGEEAWKPMLVQEFAKQIAAHGGLGLAKPVYDAMIRMQKADPK